MTRWDSARYGGREPALRPASPAHPLLLLGIPALLWLLLATTCTPFVQAVAHWGAGPLSEKQQAAFRAANRTLILEDVGAPPGTAIDVKWEVSETDDDEISVVAVTTTFRVAVPVTTHTVEAWWAAHPSGPAPSPELDAAFDTDVYRPVWRVLDEIARRLQRLGFRRDLQTSSSLRSRTVGLTRAGVTVWLLMDYPGGSVSVQRKW